MKIDLSYEESNILRGLAITAVVLVHVLAFLPGIYTLSPYRLIFISIDQLSRFCVPLFILLSGYGLTKKYEAVTIEWKSYITSRFLKLLPLYLLWTVLSYVIFQFVPQWQFYNQPESLVLQLLFGQGDYQLYFLPIIFQLYVLFPLLLAVVKKWPYYLLGLSILLQGLLYTWFSGLWSFIPVPQILSTDQVQYMFFLTWLGYFVTGMWLARTTLPTSLAKVLPWAAILGSIVIIFSAAATIARGTDPIVALRFTRLPVIGFALSSSLALIIARQQLGGIGSKLALLKRILAMVGKESYLIFLAHTIGLRLIFAALNQQVAIPTLLAVAGIWLIAVLITRKLG